ncbi:MAG: protease complex subunit PrcB family protein [Clostridia bacterium]|nr:protease complex subunit PrcB family protein [Clostridia bacterium]
MDKQVVEILTEEDLKTTDMECLNKGIHVIGQYIIISMGKKQTTGYRVEIKSIKRQEDHYVIEVAFRSPSKHSILIQQITNPQIAIKKITTRPIKIKVFYGDGSDRLENEAYIL